MRRVQQPIELAAAPTRGDWQGDVERGTDRPKRSERHAFQLAPLDERDDTLAHARGCGNVALPPAAALAHGSDRGANLFVAHGRIVGDAP